MSENQKYRLPTIQEHEDYEEEPQEGIILIIVFLLGFLSGMIGWNIDYWLWRMMQ